MAAVVSGRVSSPDGRPVAGASISVVEAPGAFPDIALLTGPDGRFDFDVPSAGTYVIAVHAPDGSGRQVSVSVGERGAAELDLTLPAAGERLP